MATIETRKGRDGKTSYRAKVRILGEPTRTRTFERKGDAKAWAASVETDLGRGAYVPTGADRRRTLADLIDKCIKEHLCDEENPNRRAHGKSDAKVAKL